MGTLDDAIREHLELKKRSGAPDDEVKRLEHEAFGPIRREAPAPAAEAPAEAPVDEAAAVPPADPPAATAPDASPEVPPAPPAGDDVAAVVSRDPAPLPPTPAPRPAPARDDEPWLDDDDLDAGPQPTSEYTAAEATDATGKPPTDHVAPDDEGEDLLEETPDFLQETPEHDRLWFEQRPPRDFDFDQ